MKRIFMMLCAVVALVSCGNVEREYYFDKTENRTYNDPEAEFDTLSYAVGMNMGLSMVLQPAGNIFDMDIIIDGFCEEIAKSEVDTEFIDKNNEYVRTFFNERMNKYVMAKRLAVMSSKEVTLPEIFDEEYSLEKVSRCFGYDMANHVRKNSYPVNVHWFVDAMNDAKTIEENSIVDDYMKIGSMDLRRVLGDYVSSDFPEYMAEKSASWLRDVAGKRGVHEIVVDGETLYYRVDKAGNGKKPQTLRDTVSLSYDVYTQRGALVESHSKRIADLKEALEKAIADTAVSPQLRDKRIERLESQLEQNENLSIVVDQAIIEGSKYGIQKVGEGGDITLWIPASLAYGERGNKMVAPNEGVVMCIHLKSVTYGPTDEEYEAMKLIKKGSPKKADGKSTIVTPVHPKALHNNSESGKGVKVIKTK